MYCNDAPLILASASPRRQDFLRWMGLHCQIEAADIDESRREGEEPESFVLRLAREKGEAVARNFPSHWVISGDTVVCLDSQVLGKPQGREEAVAMLMQLSGRTHRVLSAYSVIHQQQGIAECDFACTEVTFTSFSEAVARAYVETGEPLDKAGSYGIQQCGVALVASINGSYSNVVGLPLAELLALLERLGAIYIADAQKSG